MKKTLLIFSLIIRNITINAQDKAFECDPINNSFIEILTPIGSNLRLQTDYTIEFWLFVPTSANSQIHALNTNFDSSGSTFVRVNPVDGATSFDLNVNGNGGYHSFSSTINNFTKGIWNHFAMTYTESTGEVSMYLNGTHDKTGSFPNPIPVNNQTAKLLITANANTSTVTESVKIDDVRIWNGVRSALEINDNYNSCLTGQELNLLAYYDFESETGSVVTDKTSNGNDGTIINIDAGFNNYVLSGLDCNSLTINEKEQFTFSIYPNPATNTITIESEGKIESITILDLYGNVVSTFNSSTFDVSDFDNGIYFVRAETKLGITQSKFVKQ